MKKILLFATLAAILLLSKCKCPKSPEPQIVYKDTVFTPTNNVRDKVFRGLRIQTQISGSGWVNVKFEDCRIENIPQRTRAVNLSNPSTIVFRNNYVENCGTGFYVVDGTNIIVEHNNFKNMTGPGPEFYGQAVQFDKVKGKGNYIGFNYIVNEAGKGNNEDVISLYSCVGDVTSPIIIESNYINGGGPSPSGGGIMLGDGANSSNQRALNNVVINPGQYGIAISGGMNCEIVNNKVYGKRQSFTNVGIYVSAYSTPCGNPKVSGNEVFWINSAGNANPNWFNTNCGTIQASNNYWQSPNVSETMPAPAGCGVQGTAPPPTTNKPPYVANGPDYNAKTGELINVVRTATDEDGVVVKGQWTKNSGPEGNVKIDSLGVANWNFTFSVAGSYSYRLTVFDDKGASDFEDVLFTITQGSTTPICPPAAKKIVVDKTTKIYDGKDSLMKSVTTSETISIP